jgi:hypothetical protein
MSEDGRHERAVARSCQLAQEAAGIGEYEEALAWLQAVEVVDGPLSAEMEVKRAVWAHQSHNGAPRAGRRFTPPQKAAAAAGQNGRP